MQKNLKNSIHRLVIKLFISLYGNVIAYTDHKPVLHLLTFKDIMTKMFRWIQYIEEIAVTLVYAQRRENA